MCRDIIVFSFGEIAKGFSAEEKKRRRQILNNYWTRFSKISWFVSGEQINCLLKPKADAIIDMRNTDKSRYFASTGFNNCFIIRSPSLFSYFNHFLAVQESDLPFFSQERGSNYAWAEYYLQQNSKTRLHCATHEQTIICRQFFAGHVVGLRPMERKKNTSKDNYSCLVVMRIKNLWTRTKNFYVCKFRLKIL